jgi:hypothetical protein
MRKGSMAVLRKCAVAAGILSFLCLASCDVDLFGLFGSDDSSEREKYWDKFVYVQERGQTTPLVFDNAYSFIVLTDTHVFDAGADADEKLSRLGACINNQSQYIPAGCTLDDKFIVITGDITQTGGRASLEKVLRICDSFDIPFYPVIGNHDVWFGNFSVWRDLIGSTVYRINASNTMLLMIDSANATFGAKQLSWLQNQLNSKRTGQVNCFIFMHSNFFNGAFEDNVSQFMDFREIARALSIIDGKAGIVFSGHSHDRLLNSTAATIYQNIEDFNSNGVFVRVFVKNGEVSYHFDKIN